MLFLTFKVKFFHFYYIFNFQISLKKIFFSFCLKWYLVISSWIYSILGLNDATIFKVFILLT